MTAAIEVRGLSRTYRSGNALEDVNLSIESGVITGLLGRNGAGKTTLMSLITAQDQPTTGTVRIDGRSPFERADLIEHMCFVRDNQRYPDDYRLKHTIRAAALFYPNWSQPLADRLIDLFRLPSKPIVRKFSRGQLSALGIVLGLASQSPITFFDEPYLGLDATARNIFYDELLRSYAETPRTIILSTHLIDEMDRLLERVIVLDHGRVVRHSDADELRGSAYQVAGRSSAVESFVQDRAVLSRRTIGGLSSVVIEGSLTADVRAAAAARGLDAAQVTLQELVAAYGLGDEGAGASAGASSFDADRKPEATRNAGPTSEAVNHEDARNGRSAS